VYSRALLGPMAEAFSNSSSLHSYIDKCFLALRGHIGELLPCFLLADVSHMVKIFCRIKCFIGIKHKYLKKIYVHIEKLILLLTSHVAFSNVKSPIPKR